MSHNAEISWKQKVSRVIFFFPIQLFWVHIKKTHLLLFFWALLFAIISKSVFVKYGIPFLFLYPEYLGEVGFKSHFILGFALGGFIMAYNIASYISNGFRFPFIATLSRPFIKYSLNNFTIPFVFVLFYIYQLAVFQYYSELEPIKNVVINLSGFIVGNLAFIIISLSYFLGTNKDIFKIFSLKQHESKQTNPVKGFLHKQERWHRVFNPDREWIVETYLASPFKISLARDSKHYNKQMLRKVFSQNHINASIFEIFIIVTILILGSLRANPYFMIPAGASILLLITVIIMITSAVHSWVKGWSNAILVSLLVILNFISKNDRFKYTNYAYGLNYQTEKAPYNNNALDSIANDNKVALADFKSGVDILNNWRIKNYAGTAKKPKLVIVSASGGGLRSALWTYQSLQHIDSILNGKLMNHIHLITGSSGGMVGAAYLREIYLNEGGSLLNIDHQEHFKNISKDILNPIAFTMALSDPFIRYQKFNDGYFNYTKDRGYEFEKQLNLNLNGAFKKRLADYRVPEEQAQIPMMILAPAIANDGRKLLISPQDIGYMANTDIKSHIKNNFLTDAVEFRKLLKKQWADSVRFSTALRMNATFPYVMINTSLPTDPTIEIMDAGVRDNSGVLVALRYLYTFRNWIATNTDGVIFIQIRDKPKSVAINNNPNKTIVENIKGPFGGFYGNWANMQNLNQEEIIHYSNSWFKGNLNVLGLELDNSDQEYISLSWHLTKKEKQQVLNSINTQHNQQVIEELKELLN